MRCRECKALLWDYLDGELSDAGRTSVETHLAACAQCSLAHERLRAFPLQPSQLTAVPPPPDFTTRLMRRIEPLPPPRELAGVGERNGAFGSAIGVILACSSAAAAVTLGLLSLSAMALLTGGPPPARLYSAGEPIDRIANALGVWIAAQFWALLSWPVLIALCGMQVVLATLWFRIVVAPQRRTPPGYGAARGPLPRRR